VYADWLVERGDPLGELIQVQATENADPNLRLREAALIAARRLYAN
jgi:hypothetical protein